MNASPDNLTSATLLLRLRDLDDQEAWDEFVERYAPQVFYWCRENYLQDSDARDVTQEVLSKLVISMREFEYRPDRGSFRGWLKVVTRNTVRDLGRKWEQRIRGSGDTNVHDYLHRLADRSSLDSLADSIESRFNQEVLAEAEQRVKLRVHPRTWEAYFRTAVQQETAKQASEALEMTVSEVYVAKSRVLKLLRDEVAILDQSDDD
jgi:RNA polymerase sigma-70 factor (ECF subfamily)